MTEWHDAAITAPGAASETAVRDAERALRVRLPIDFLAVAREHQGAAPAPAKVTLPDGSVTGVAHLLHFEDEPGFTNIVARRFPVAEVLDKGIIPFAEDVGGDLFCFNYRQDPERPSVVYWSVDTGAVPLASDFTAFVAALHD